MPPAIPPTIAPVLLLLCPLELALTDGVIRMVDWMVVVTITPSAPVELFACGCQGV